MFADINLIISKLCAKLSRPARARGLKRHSAVEVFGVNRSRPARARGLKLLDGKGVCAQVGRAPHGRVD